MSLTGKKTTSIQAGFAGLIEGDWVKAERVLLSKIEHNQSPLMSYLGAAYAAGLAVGFFDDLDHLRSLWAEDHRWEPSMVPTERDRLYTSWKKAVTI